MIFSTNKLFSTLVAILLLAPCHLVQSKIALDLTHNAFAVLKSYNIITPDAPIKLHLGCGEQHFKEYINIDFPPSEHTLQTTVAADVYADLTTINFPLNSVDEIRSHHVFEHFDRSTALALLAKWHKWLKPGGIVIIETPDLEASLLLLLNTHNSYETKQAVLRHVFGSHEASWALHYDGWYKQKFEYILSRLGFGAMNFTFTDYLMTRNITVRAIKLVNLDDAMLYKEARSILETSLVLKEAEQKLLDIWCNKFNTVFLN